MPLYPNVCKSCGTPHGHVLELFEESKNAKVTAASKHLDNPGNIMIIQTPNPSIRMKEDLDTLHVVKVCCRTDLLTWQDFNSYI